MLGGGAENDGHGANVPAGCGGRAWAASGASKVSSSIAPTDSVREVFIAVLPLGSRCLVYLRWQADCQAHSTLFDPCRERVAGRLKWRPLEVGDVRGEYVADPGCRSCAMTLRSHA